MYRIAICDDDSVFLDYEKKIIEEHMNTLGINCEVQKFISGDEFMNSIERGDTYNLVFLDVELQGADGISIAYSIRNKNLQIPVAIVSAYINYSPDGYRVEAVRFILKNSKLFAAYINECIDYVIATNKQNLFSMDFNLTIGVRNIVLRDILYIESNRNYTNFIMIKDLVEKYTIRKTLKDLTNQLSGHNFVQISSKRSVNLAHIMDASRYEVILDNGDKLTISQSRYKDVHRVFTLYKGSNL